MDDSPPGSTRDHDPSHDRSNSTPSSPSHFPRPTLTRIPSASSLSARSSDDLCAPDAAAALAGIHPPDLSMQPEPSGHRRRRSSLMNNLDGSSKGKTRRTSRSPTKRNDILEEPKTGDVADDDDSKTASEDVELDDLSDDGLQDDEETGLTGKDKGRRRQKRRRNTLLDQRIAGDIKITDEEKKEADQNVFKKSLVNGILIGLWYIFSLSISIYNKWMFSSDHLDFHFPLFTTYSDLAQHEADSKKPLMTRMFYFTRIGPCGMATGLDIGLGNTSLKFITLTFYTMCKSSSLAFVLLFAFLFRLETPSWRLVAIIATMTVGVVMMVAGEVDFSALGFVLVISAAFFSGFRWGLTQILLLRNPATSNPFSSIFYLAPVMFASLLILAIPVEGFPALYQGLLALMDAKGHVLGPCILLFPGAIAFCMTSAEFALLQRTSVVTLSIAGIFKEVVTILAAGLIFHDTLTPINISGLFVTIGAITAYNYIKIRKMREDAQLEAHKLHAIDRGSDSGSDADGESGDSDDEEWNTAAGVTVTSDGDIIPTPGSAKKKGQSSRNSERTKEELAALAASKRELSD
ncbi:putative transporter [Lachnellula suecica]|uniref:Putative transporter n=1 Tax=Lachnellula suecica TaxID=602035 RepID=A0A8T9CEH1_9HELO|nr:putative transporter [Lachnellula suecica]